MEMNAIESMLNQIKLVSDKHTEIEKITGSVFNVFEILGLSTREVRTHSAFISELLNSKGSHKQEEWKLFLKMNLS